MSRRKPAEKKQISQEWLTTYSDMMTLLLTFFVLLYSFSVVDNTKFKRMANSLQNALLGGAEQTIFDYNEKKGDVPIVGDITAADQNSEMSTAKNSAYDAIVDFVEKNSLGEFVTIKGETRGVVIEFRDKILFDTGKADIKNEGVPVLMKLAELIRSMPNPIIIEGHTDNVPIRTSEFPSNWELSSARALKILKYMIEDRQLGAERFSAAAYGEYRPVADNSTEDGKAQNRRVNIVIVSTEENPVKK